MAQYGQQPGFVLPNQAPVQQSHNNPLNQQPAYPAYPGQTYPQPYPPGPNQNSSYQPFPQPIQQHQPSSGGPMPVNWMGHGDFSTYLTNSRALHIAQKKELLEIIVNWEAPNKYSVKDENGNKIFYVGEDSNMCYRQCFSHKRPFRLDVKDKAGNTVLMIDRELDCDLCCGLLCPDEIKVSTPNGQVLGYVKQEFSLFRPLFSIQDANRQSHLKIVGPYCQFACLGPIEFHVHAMNEARVGAVSKQWSNIIQEMFTDADNFYISYPVDLHVNLKAVCMAAAFLIDFRYFENNQS